MVCRKRKIRSLSSRNLHSNNKTQVINKQAKYQMIKNAMEDYKIKSGCMWTWVWMVSESFPEEIIFELSSQRQETTYYAKIKNEEFPTKEGTCVKIPQKAVWWVLEIDRPLCPKDRWWGQKWYKVREKGGCQITQGQSTSLDFFWAQTCSNWTL